MNHFLRFVILLTLLSSGRAAYAQKVLMVRNPSTAHRFFYEVGDKIFILAGEPSFQVKGVITAIGDSTMILDKTYEIPYSDVHRIYRQRGFLRRSWPNLMLAGVAYSTISIINRGSHNDKPLIDNTIPWISGSLLGSAAVFYYFSWRKLPVPGKWQLKVLDYDVFRKEKGVQEPAGK
jgi:hypothetical protein